MIKYFCSSDIHSFYTEWMLALASKGFDINNSEHKIIVCGDLFDRGDESIECFEFMKKLTAEGRAIYVRGNHEDMLFDCCKTLHRCTGSHHVSNGTVKTVSHFLGLTEAEVLCNLWNSREFNEKVQPLLDFIAVNAVDYYKLGNTVFVHGWVPTGSNVDGTYCIKDWWREGNWKQARWANGMEMYYFDITIPDKTIVCGHWHTSYGHKLLSKTCETEFGPDACFDELILKGLVALDACTAYTHKVNVVIFDEEGNLVNEVL